MDNTAVAISVVVVTWNARKYVEECLASLLAQEGCPVTEVIVVDNASSDGTPELIAARFPSVRLARNRFNVGFAKGNNKGIRLSRGKYLFLVNSDVKVPPDCLAKLHRYMESEVSIGMLGPRMLSPNGAVGRSTMRFPTVWNFFCCAVGLDSLFSRSRAFAGFQMGDFAHDRTLDVDVLNGWFWVVRRSALDQVGILDEGFFMYGEDIEWCRRFRDAGVRVVFYPGAEAVHYGGASTAQSPVRFYIEMRRATRQYFARHHGKLALFGFVAVGWLHEIVRVLGYGAKYSLLPSGREKIGYKVERSLKCLAWSLGLHVPEKPGTQLENQ